MMSYNKVTLLGNITRDIELRYTPSGKAVCDVNLAVNDNRKNGDTTFVQCTCWDKTAELASQYLAKGRQVLFEGRLKMDEWNDKETGQKRTKLGVVVEKMVFVGGNGEGRQEAPKSEIDESSDIPF